MYDLFRSFVCCELKLIEIRNNMKVLMYWILQFFKNYTEEVKSKGLPRQAEVAQGVPGRLRPRIS